VGAGFKSFSESARPMESVIPQRVDWLRDSVAGFLPDKNMVVTSTGEHVGYDFLVVAPGMQTNWGAVPGLEEALGKGGVCSNYSDVVGVFVCLLLSCCVYKVLNYCYII
jgi:NADPH-dependent 2,4-dienoyl-CoA reductase/sulfur reductase-like enzyme